MKYIYLDSASNNKMKKEVIKYYKKILSNKYLSNPSSLHYYGIKTRGYIEIAREKISKIINCESSEIYFTSSGTEGNNIIIKLIVNNLKIKNIITSKLEHLSVLKTILNIKKKNNNIKLYFIKNNSKGILDINKLKKILKKIKKENNLVSIMSINNEIGNINNYNKIGKLCKKYNTYYHSDFVQYIGHYKINIKKIFCDFLTASAHKFYGPLGIGFIYINKRINIKINIYYNNIKSSTNNIYGILGLYKALQINNKNYKIENKKILLLKKKCIKYLKKNINNIKFNGLSNNLKKSSINILNIRLPIKDNLLHIKLELKGIIISKNSTCSNYSHVLKNIINKKEFKNTTSIRISFNIFNKYLDIKLFIYELKNIINNNNNNFNLIKI
ncbi:MAG: cysteine desulfurase [Flavobacteriales endosymbiont of Rhyzopertha dominica]|nr:MAG: aminotransferase class V-fold PLP-dependent enzyme [Candidatus Shikimatogenerans bostrichidophilus]